MKYLTEKVYKRIGPEKEAEGYFFSDGYAKLLRCNLRFQGENCGKIFNSYSQLAEHQAEKHSVCSSRYSVMPATGDYLRSRMENCGKVLVYSEPANPIHTEEQEILFSCYNRGCPFCHSKRRLRYARNFENTVSFFKRVSVLTTTFKGYRPLNRAEKQAAELQTRNFMKMLQRRAPAWNMQYIRVLEVVKKETGYYYHHHFLIDLPFIPQEDLSGLWDKATDGSFVVDIRILRNPRTGEPIGKYWGRLTKKERGRHALCYISKYLSKPLGDSVDLDLYARIVYRKHFVESRLDKRAVLFESLHLLIGRNSSTETQKRGRFLKPGLCFDRQKTAKRNHQEKPPPKTLLSEWS